MIASIWITMSLGSCLEVIVVGMVVGFVVVSILWKKFF